VAVAEKFAELASRIRRSTPRLGEVRLVAIDGPGGAGKSTFAQRLSASLDDAPIVATDDFASWQDPLGWWDRLEREVLRPLARGKAARYRAYDWTRRRPGRWRQIPVSEVVILEGVSSSRRAVRDRLSFAIWIETPRDQRLARGLDRDGVVMTDQWQKWMAEEEAHFAKDPAADEADLVVDGSAWPPDPDQYIRIR